MKPSRVIFGTFITMVIVQTVGSIDGVHRLPAPKKYVAISAVWGILFLVSDIGFGKLAARLSMLILLTGMVIGPFGSLVIATLNKITENFAIPPEDDTAASGVPGTPGVTPTRPRGTIA